MPVGSGGGGPSGSSGDIRAGGAYFEIVGKDGASRVIAHVKNEITKLDKSIKKVGNLAGVGGLIGGILGGTGGFVGGSTLTGVLARFGSALGKELAEAATSAGVMRIELERSVKLADELAVAVRKGFAREDAEIAAIDDRFSRIEFLENALAQASKESMGLERTLHNIRNQIKDMAGEDLEPTMWNPNNWLGTPELDNLKKNLDGVEKRYKETRERVAKHQKDLDVELNPQIDPARRAKMEAKFTENFRRDFRNPSINPFLKTLNSLLRDPEAEMNARQAALQRYINTHGGSPMFQGMGQMLNVGLRTIGTLGPTLELLRGFETRTGMGGGNAAARFGFGDTVAQLSLKAQEQIAMNTAPAVVGKAVGDALAIRLRMN